MARVVFHRRAAMSVLLLILSCRSGTVQAEDRCECLGLAVNRETVGDLIDFVDHHGFDPFSFDPLLRARVDGELLATGEQLLRAVAAPVLERCVQSDESGSVHVLLPRGSLGGLHSTSRREIIRLFPEPVDTRMFPAREEFGYKACGKNVLVSDFNRLGYRRMALQITSATTVVEVQLTYRSEPDVDPTQPEE